MKSKMTRWNPTHQAEVNKTDASSLGLRWSMPNKTQFIIPGTSVWIEIIFYKHYSLGWTRD